MTVVSSLTPQNEEDLGYLAAKAGRGLETNPFPPGTIRHKDWRSGWQIHTDAIARRESEGYRAAQAGVDPEANPHPRGTIRYDEWRRDWQALNNEVQRDLRLGSA